MIRPYFNNWYTGTYFGQQTYSWDCSGFGGDFNVYTNLTHACPSSGSIAIDSLEVYVLAPLMMSVKVAIYTVDGSLIAESTSAKTPGTSMAWLAWSSSELTWHNGYNYLTGGTYYRLAVFVMPGETYVRFGVNTCTTGDIAGLSSQSYSSMPDPIPGGLSNTNAGLMIRCRVSAGGGGFIAKARRSISQRVGVRGG